MGGAASRAVGAPRLEPTQDRFRLFGPLTKLLKRAVSDQPLVLMLDDFHRADDSSLLLRFLTRDLADGRLLVVAPTATPAPTREKSSSTRSPS